MSTDLIPTAEPLTGLTRIALLHFVDRPLRTSDPDKARIEDEMQDASLAAIDALEAAGYELDGLVPSPVACGGDLATYRATFKRRHHAAPSDGVS
jgi:hypothetical protein